MKLPKYNNKEKFEFGTIMSNWTYLALHLADINDESTLLKMIRFELDNKGRVLIVNRLKQKFNKLRNRRENLELIKIFETSQSANP